MSGQTPQLCCTNCSLANDIENLEMQAQGERKKINSPWVNYIHCNVLTRKLSKYHLICIPSVDISCMCFYYLFMGHKRQRDIPTG